MRDLRSFDLNLLLSLQALLTERSVTRAAERMGLSQPALSGSLARLRRHFDDELLIRVDSTYRLTPLGHDLLERTGPALAAAERVFSSSRSFDAATSQRSFTVLASDYAQSILGEALSRATAASAPGVRLELRQHGPDVTEAASTLLLDADALVFPRGYLTDLPHAPLFRDTWCCLIWVGNRQVGPVLTMDHLAQLSWVVTFRTPVSATPAMRQLELLGIEADVKVVVDTFSSLPNFLVGTDRIALVQTRLAEQLQRWHPVRWLACPFAAPPLAEDLWWHPAYQRDPAHTWLRELLLAAGRTATGEILPARIEVADAGVGDGDFPPT